MAMKTDKKIIAAVAIVSLSVAALGWFAFFYETKQIQNTADTIQKKKLESLVLQEKRDKIFKLKKDLKDIENYKSEMDKMLISKDDAVVFLRSVEGIATGASTSIKIESADLSKLKIGSQKNNPSSSGEETPTAQTKDQQVVADLAAEKAKQKQADQLKTKLGFTIELAGTYPTLVDFLDKMENLPYFINIYNMDLTDPNKLNQPTAPVGGVLPAGNPAANPGAPVENKNIKMTMLVIVNTNDGK